MSKKQIKKTTATHKTTSAKAVTPKAKAATTRASAKQAASAKQGASRAPTSGGTANRTLAGGAGPRKPEPRLPAPGTVIQKLDRHGTVRCECTVEDGGIRYDDTVYRSLSAAAMAAAGDLGLKNKTQNGFTFWGLTKPPTRSADPVDALERAWARYRGNLAAVVKDRVTDDNRAKVLATLHTHAQAIDTARHQVA